MEQSRLYRSYKNSIIGGVCGGLGEYLNTDPILFRVLFAVAFLVGGTGLLAYIILWIVIPIEEIPNISQRDSYDKSSNSINMEEENNNSETQPENMEEQKKHQKNDGNLWGGLILITLGAIFLIDRFVPRIDFGDLWPLILIVVGVILISKNYQSPKK
ncbi:MAG: PspC domain-containing protein [Bacteroidales bacterium]|nr:PspC domain-containing protein [Bacteroidales bacterium]